MGTGMRVVGKKCELLIELIISLLCGNTLIRFGTADVICPHSECLKEAQHNCAWDTESPDTWGVSAVQRSAMLQRGHFKGSSKVRKNNQGSPIMVKANTTAWPAQMWKAGQALKNVNMAVTKHQKTNGGQTPFLHSRAPTHTDRPTHNQEKNYEGCSLKKIMATT